MAQSSHSQKCSTWRCCRRARTNGGAEHSPGLVMRSVSTRNSFPSLSRRKGLAHWALAHRLSIIFTSFLACQNQWALRNPNEVHFGCHISSGGSFKVLPQRGTSSWTDNCRRVLQSACCRFIVNTNCFDAGDLTTISILTLLEHFCPATNFDLSDKENGSNFREANDITG